MMPHSHKDSPPCWSFIYAFVEAIPSLYQSDSLWSFYLENNRCCGRDLTTLPFHDIVWNPEPVDQTSVIPKIQVLAEVLQI